MNRILFAFALFVALLLSCRKDSDITTIHQASTIPSEQVESSLSGRVSDASNMPIVGAAVEVAGLMLTTNDQGFFFVHKKLMDKNGTYVKVSKSGFFNAAEFAFPRLGTHVFVEIKMLRKSDCFRSTFDASEGATIMDGSGTSITIPANAIATANGQAYTGTVTATHAWLNPVTQYWLQFMPGDRRAQDSVGYAKVLNTFGMVGVALESPSGDKLNLLDGKKASVSMPASGLLQGAPASIPIWHFDEADGYWKEKGHATLSGSEYAFEVGHFSFCSYGLPKDYVLLSGCVGDMDGNALANVQIDAISTNYSVQYGHTDSEGQFGAVVPANEPLRVRILDNCGHGLYEDALGSLLSNTDIGKIKIPAPVTITGTLADCNLVPLAEGVAIIANDSATLVVVPCDVDGHFKAIMSNCTSNLNVHISGFDYGSLFQSTPLDASANNNIILDVGTIQVCRTLDEFIIMTVNGQTTNFLTNLSFDSEIGAGYLSGRQGWIVGDTSSVYVSFGGVANQKADINHLSGTYLGNSGYNSYGCYYCPGCNCATTDTENLIFTNFPTASGEYVIGSASGMVRAAVFGGGLVPYSINFKIKKQ